MKLYKNRLIAFFDILGFSVQLQTVELSELHLRYSQFIDDVKSRAFRPIKSDLEHENFEKAQFLFDSVVLVSKPIDDNYNIFDFTMAARELMSLSFKHILPLRGAISLGDFLDDDERNIFLSDKFPELVKFEGNQEWSGCTILEQAEEVILNGITGSSSIDSQNQNANAVLLQYDIPTKSKLGKEHLTLNYYYFLSDEEIEKGLTYLKGVKHSETVKYFEWISSLHDHDKHELKDENGNSNLDQNGNRMFVKIMKATCGFSVLIVDEDNNAVENPPIINWTAVGKKPEK